jgi:hypothetical protein
MIHIFAFANIKNMLQRMGTWAAAVWAIHFYERHGFQMVSPQEKDRLLKRYWTIPERQIDTSVVLADPKWWQLSVEV